MRPIDGGAIMVTPNIIDSDPKTESLRIVSVNETPSLTSSYGKVAAGVIRRKRPMAVSLPGTCWETTDVISRHVLDDYNTLLSASGDVGHNLAPTFNNHINAYGLSVAVMAERGFALSLMGMVHLQHKVWHMYDIPIDQPLRIAAWAQNMALHHAGTTVELWVPIFAPMTEKL